MPKKEVSAQKSTAKRGRKQAPRGKTDPEQHERFLETAMEADASDDPKAFDRAFERIAKSPKE
ncbi:MAG: hypothetical protein GC206_07985 [Alphaproteobacteria bacterium]|nr:hypothetical protein [Alphaproteobacteria bacterium]